MKRKAEAEDEIDAYCRSVKRLKPEDTEENGKLIRCTICDMLCQAIYDIESDEEEPEENENFHICPLCYYDGCAESDEEFTISE